MALGDASSLRACVLVASIQRLLSQAREPAPGLPRAERDHGEAEQVRAPGACPPCVWRSCDEELLGSPLQRLCVQGLGWPGMPCKVNGTEQIPQPVPTMHRGLDNASDGDLRERLHRGLHGQGQRMPGAAWTGLLVAWGISSSFPLTSVQLLGTPVLLHPSLTRGFTEEAASLGLGWAIIWAKGPLKELR